VTSLGFDRLYAITAPVHYRVHGGGEIAFRVAVSFSTAVTAFVGVVQLAFSSHSLALETCSPLELSHIVIDTRNFTQVALFLVGCIAHVSVIYAVKTRMSRQATQFAFESTNFNKRQAAITRSVLLIFTTDAIIVLSTSGQIVGMHLRGTLDENSRLIMVTLCTLVCVIACVCNFLVFRLRNSQMTDALHRASGVELMALNKNDNGDC